MTETDLELLKRYTRERAEDAFAEIVRRHLDLVYSAALRQVRSPQLAEEISQSAFLDLARNGAQLKPDTILAAWLYQVTRRTAIDVVRREVRRQLREQIATEMNTSNATAADWTHLEPLLDEAMAALDATDRAAVLLRYFENKSLREVGQQLGVSDDAAQKRVSRAVERLREFFAQRGVCVGATGMAVLISTNAVQSAPAGLAVAISAAATLAGAGLVTTATTTATKAIAMTTLQKTLITAAFVAAVGTGIYEARQAAHLRSQVQMLQQQQAPLIKQSQELSQALLDATNQLAAVKDDNARLNRNTLELLRLRSEVGRLRQALSELGRPRQETTQAPTDASDPTKAPMVAFGTKLEDLGAATPERALTSLIWAARTGNQARVAELLELPKNVAAEEAVTHYGFFTKRLGNTFNDMEFTSIQGIKQNPDGTLRLNLVDQDFTSGKTNPFPFILRLHDSGWKVVVEGEAPPTLPSE